MFVEINLVHSTQIFSNVFSLIARHRVEVADDNGVMGAIIDFIKDNISVFDAGLADKDLVNKLSSLSHMNVSEFYSLKFILAQAGIDILVNQVAEMEVNSEEIAEGTLEYSVIDNLDADPTFARTASKIVVPDNSSNLSEVYEKAIDGYDFFNSELTNGYANPLKTNVQLVKQTEMTMGVSPTSITSYINSVLQYLGKSLIVITN